MTVRPPACLSYFVAAFVLAPLAAAEPSAAQNVRLSELDLSEMTAGWRKARADESVGGAPLSIDGRRFEHGVGTHAESVFMVDLFGGALGFRAQVGVDDEVGDAAASVVFEVRADGERMFVSEALRAGDAPVAVDVDLRGKQRLALLVTDAGDGMDYDHADWAAAEIDYVGQRPQAVALAGESAGILTPPAPSTPRINGARVFGVRPERPCLYTIAATGQRPMRFSARHLPAGLTLDAETGRLTGRVAQAGTYRVTLEAENALGRDRATLRLVVGDKICLTPPMGWNSWNCFAGAVDADKVKAAADALVSSGLINHGWQYVNVDDFWQKCPDRDDPTLQGPGRDDAGRIVPNPRFPDMKALADYVHARGLKFGVYSSPGPRTCGGCLGSYGHEVQDAETYAAWGVDYLKYDLCSYFEKMQGRSNLGAQYEAYELMGEALRAQDRDIVYSICQYGLDGVAAWGADVGGNCWRTTGDISDNWSSMSGIGFKQAGLEHFAGPGRWNDPDMLVVGKVGWGPKLRETNLTPNEQYAHISLWCLLSAPLLIGCDLTQLDEFTLNLLTNDEVLAVNQDPLGRQASRVAKDEHAEVWAKRLEDGSLAVGLFNRGPLPREVVADFSDLGLSGAHAVRDLWRQKDLGRRVGVFAVEVPRHGVMLVKISPLRE